MIIDVTLLDLKYALLYNRLSDLYEDKTITGEDLIRLTDCKYLTNLLVTPIDPFSKLPDVLFEEALALYQLDEDINPWDFTETVMKDLITEYLKRYYKEHYTIRGDSGVIHVYFISNHNPKIQLRVKGDDLIGFLQGEEEL